MSLWAVIRCSLSEARGLIVKRGTFQGQSGTGQCRSFGVVGLLIWPLGPVCMRDHMAGARVGDVGVARLYQRLSESPSVLRVCVVRERFGVFQILSHFVNARGVVVCHILED